MFEVVIGVFIYGKCIICLMKYVGLNVVVDFFFIVFYIGVNVGFLIVVVDDLGMYLF